MGISILLNPAQYLSATREHRSEERAAMQVGGWMKKEGWEVKYAPIDEFYVHIDLMVCMVAEKCAAVCLDTTSDDVLEWLRKRNIEMIPVSFRDTMKLACTLWHWGMIESFQRLQQLN